MVFTQCTKLCFAFQKIESVNGFDRPTRLLRFVAFVHLLFSFRSLDPFCCFTRVYERHFMLYYKEEF